MFFCSLSLSDNSGLYWGVAAALYATQRKDGFDRGRQAWSGVYFKCL